MSYNHKEAFALMWYACKCGHRERIWNSRDGVTPFSMNCPSCNSEGSLATLIHVDWGKDVCKPDHKPFHGQRVWIDMTEARAVEIVDSRLEAALKAGRVLNDYTERRSAMIASFFEHGTQPDLRVEGYGNA